MKITPLTIDFDVTNEQEVAFINELMNRLFGGAPLKAMSAPTENPVNSTSVPTFSEPTQTAAPVQEVKEEPKQETITEAIAEVKKEMKKPVKPKTVKEASQATIDPEPIQAPVGEEKAPEKASSSPSLIFFLSWKYLLFAILFNTFTNSFPGWITLRFLVMLRAYI